MNRGDTEADTLSVEKATEVRASFSRQGLMRAFGAELSFLSPSHCTIGLPFSETVGQQQGFSKVASLAPSPFPPVDMQHSACCPSAPKL